MDNIRKKKQKPEEKELEEKLSELMLLEAELTQRELDLATLQAELTIFRGEYLRIVGVRYKELDEIKAKIAEYLSKANPKDNNAKARARKARDKANKSASEIRGSPTSQGISQEFKPSESLRKLYREIAKCVHPDLVTDEEERLRRQKFMAEVNRAYQDGDEERLQRIFQEWEFSPESVTGEGIGNELIRTIRKITKIRERLSVIEEQIDDLRRSDTNQRRIKAIAAQNEGRDFLREMASHLDIEIADAKEQLSKLILESILG
jgi:hypothetical protein